jgi:hypothetical protein
MSPSSRGEKCEHLLGLVDEASRRVEQQSRRGRGDVASGIGEHEVTGQAA